MQVSSQKDAVRRCDVALSPIATDEMCASSTSGTEQPLTTQWSLQARKTASRKQTLLRTHFDQREPLRPLLEVVSSARSLRCSAVNRIAEALQDYVEVLQFRTGPFSEHVQGLDTLEQPVDESSLARTIQDLLDELTELGVAVVVSNDIWFAHGSGHLQGLDGMGTPAKVGNWIDAKVLDFPSVVKRTPNAPRKPDSHIVKRHLLDPQRRSGTGRKAQLRAARPVVSRGYGCAWVDRP